MGRRGLLVVAVVAGMLASGCTSASEDTDRGATKQTAPSAKVALADLPPLAAPADDGSPRGLVGDRWTVHIPATADPAVTGIGIVGGVRVVLSDGPGDPLGGTKTYRLFDALRPDGVAPLYEGQSPEVDVDLRNGDVYQYSVTSTTGESRGPFTFTVGAANPVAGAYSASISSDEVATGAGTMAIGLAFTTADVGTTAATAAENGLRGGLPPGWSWTGVGSGITQVVVENASNFAGADKVIEVHHEGGDITVLGCLKVKGWGCSALGGSASGPPLQATITDESAADLTLQDPESGRSWTVETWGVAVPGDPDDTLGRREGRVVATAAPGSARTEFSYVGAETEDVSSMSWYAAGDGSPLTWTIHRDADAACGGDVPPGFVANPPGAVCGWTLPSGASVRLLYVEVGKDERPQIGRAMRLPAGACDPGSFAACQEVWDQVAVNDLAWSATGHPRAMRDPGATQAVMAGAVAPGDESMVTVNRFDSLGRIDEVTAAAAAPDGPRSIGDHTYPAPDGGFPGATHVLAVTQRADDGSGSTAASAKAVDDGLREVGHLEPSGARVVQVWHADRDLELARLGSDGTASAQVFDEYDRSIGTYELPIAALNKDACQAGTRDPKACAPGGAWGEVSGRERTYDGPGIPQGLVAEWFSTRSVTGVPVGRTAVDSFDDGTASLVLTPPKGADLKAGALRITGALALKQAITALTVDVKGGTTDAGWAFINGRYYGGLSGGSDTLDLDEGAKALPWQFEVVLTFSAGPPTGLSLLRRQGGNSVALRPTELRQRFGVVTQDRAAEAYPVGSSTFKGVATSYAYEDLAATKPTSTTEAACGTAGSWDAVMAACRSASGGITTSATFEDDGVGGVRLATTKVPGTGTISYAYWGPGAKPDGSGLPGDVAGAPQRGLLRSATYPDGRVDSTAFDQEGHPACRSTSGGPWSCSEHDGAGRVVREVYRSSGATDVVVEHEYGFDQGPSPRTDTITRRDGDQLTSTEVARFTAGGNLASYEMRLDLAAGGGAAATTTYRYDGLQRPTGRTTTVAPGTGGGTAGTFETTMAYDPTSGALASLAIDGKEAAVIANDPNLHVLSGVTYPGLGGASLRLGLDASLRPTNRTWSLPGGATVEDRTTVSAGGRVLASSFDGLDTTYTYDGLGRLTAARTPDAAALYGWDDGHNLVCTARGAAPDAADCASADGKVTNTYDGGRLTATSDPAWKLPADAYDGHGNLLGAGDRSFTYDARQQVAKIASTDATLMFGRDSSGRVVTRAGESADGTTRLLYAGPSEATAVAELAPAAGPRFSTALPGGMLWTSDGAAIPDPQGSPAVWLAADGTRNPDVATRRYDPFGVELTAPPAVEAPTDGSTTTTTTTASTTTTAPDATTTTTTAPDAATTTTTAAPTGDTTTTVAPDAAGGTTTTSAEGASTTTTPASTTTTAAEPSTTTTTAPTAPAAGPPLDVHGWSDRITLDDGLVNLGERMLIPALGIFSGPDPIPGGSCTVYGYTCADPVNSRDLTGTMSTGQVVVLAIGLLFALFMPATAPAFEFTLASFAVQLAKQVLIGAIIAGAGGHVVAACIDRNWWALSARSILNAALTGAIAGGAAFLGASLLTGATRFTGEMASESADYAFGVKTLQKGVAAADDDGLYGVTEVSRGYRTMGGPRSIFRRFREVRAAGEAFFTRQRTSLIVTGLLIGTTKLGINQGTNRGLTAAETEYGF